MKTARKVGIIGLLYFVIEWSRGWMFSLATKVVFDKLFETSEKNSFIDHSVTIACFIQLLFLAGVQYQ